MADRFDILDKVAVVTGATKGIGRGVVEGLAQAGAKVVVTSRNQEDCDKVAAEVAETTGAECFPLAADVASWDGLPDYVAKVYDRFDRVDILLNNAGINPKHVTLLEMDEEYWDQVIGVNLKGPLRLASLVANRMKDQGGGSIINVSSIGGYRGGPEISPYSASKAALINLTKTMALEWAPYGIRVNCISPGPFISEIMKRAEERDPGYLERVGQGVPLKRIGDPEEMTGAVIYLGSDASSFVTGEDHMVSGGITR